MNLNSNPNPNYTFEAAYDKKRDARMPRVHRGLGRDCTHLGEATRSEPLDMSSPVLTVLGLRPRPSADAPTQARE
eukprot:scaffold24580_cov39-Phaeocystis_antarctica.AAC.2